MNIHAFRELDDARAAVKTVGIPKITLAAFLAAAITSCLIALSQPLDRAMFVFFAIGLVPAAIAYRICSSYDADIGARAPELFYDLSEHVKASGSLAKALRRVAEGEYGTMSDEVLRVLSEIEHEGYDLASSLRAMAERVNNKYVTRSVAAISEALTSSPDVEGALKMVAADGRLARSLEAERRAGIFPATLVMYLAALVFMIVVSFCITSFAPISHQLRTLSSAEAPVIESPGDAAMPYYVLSISVAACTGLTIGVMRDGSIYGGFKDATALITAAFLAYELIVFQGFDLAGVAGL